MTEETSNVREQQLELEVATLSSQVTRLEKVVTGLNAENEILVGFMKLTSKIFKFVLFL